MNKMQALKSAAVRGGGKLVSLEFAIVDSCPCLIRAQMGGGSP